MRKIDQRRQLTEEGRERLTWAILHQALVDWGKQAKLLWSSAMRVLAMRELKQLINFVMSDWYVYLTDGNSCQETILNGLIDRITYNDAKKELYEYAKSKSKKPYLIGINRTTSSPAQKAM